MLRFTLQEYFGKFQSLRMVLNLGTKKGFCVGVKFCFQATKTVPSHIRALMFILESSIYSLFQVMEQTTISPAEITTIQVAEESFITNVITNPKNCSVFFG